MKASHRIFAYLGLWLTIYEWGRGGGGGTQDGRSRMAALKDWLGLARARRIFSPRPKRTRFH